MFKNLDLFRMSSAMAAHAGQKQALTAQNVANADTPGYIARDLADFRTTFDPGSGAAHPKATRSSHLHGVSAMNAMSAPLVGDGRETPNGNTVSLETEMLKSVSAKRQHDRALAIYKTALSVLRSTIRS
ncbi:FlgB family protein [Sulfitobacter sp. M368]|uniref:FlgB family protein n=1 Tax=Sulfitobacter sp. M368 TaxID=2867021 RepID=UPI0021A68F0C|nr:FlgB family protein [Sulfitobacter sp. M368]UWR15274.1 FlgB family protein [Sulfitobacter sp. M368]